MKVYALNDPEARMCFKCPGCGRTHQIPTIGPAAKWQFNNNLDSPTFFPSLLVTSGYYVAPQLYAVNHPSSFLCHSFITDGKIQFLNDCTHQLAGQTVDLNDI